MFDRVAYVEFITASGEMKRLEGIDVKFSISKYMGVVMNEAIIDIYNLAKEDIEYLTTFTSQFIAYDKRKRIRIFGGYKDTSVGLLFDGDIVEALPTTPPDIILRCKAMTGHYGNSTIISKSITKTIPVKDAVKQASEWMGKELNDFSTTDRKIDGFYFTGASTQLIGQINNIPDITCFEDDGALTVVDSKNPNINKEIKKISSSSGMINIPQPDALGIKVKILLDPTISLGQTIQIESSSIPACNGQYWIYEFTHRGHLRGSEFYTEISARRK